MFFAQAHPVSRRLLSLLSQVSQTAPEAVSLLLVRGREPRSGHGLCRTEENDPATTTPSITSSFEGNLSLSLSLNTHTCAEC